MNTTYMQFKSFIWKTNPYQIEISSKSNIQTLHLPYAGNVLQQTGAKPRVITGEGEFTGPTAQEQFDHLQELFLEGGTGALFLPGLKPFNALFSSFKITEQANPEWIRYQFEFIENTSVLQTNTYAEKFHTVRENEFLWDISALYMIPIERLMALNPQCMDPWDIEKEERIRIE